MNDRPFASPDEADNSPVDRDQKAEPPDHGLVSVNGRAHPDVPRRPSSARSRRPANGSGKPAHYRNGAVVDRAFESAKRQSLNHDAKSSPYTHPALNKPAVHRRPWYITIPVLLLSLVGLSLLGTILHSLSTRQLDPKGCRMSYMRPSYVKYSDFDTEHTRFATKYSLYLYREQGDSNEKVQTTISSPRPHRALILLAMFGLFHCSASVGCQLTYFELYIATRRAGTIRPRECGQL